MNWERRYQLNCENTYFLSIYLPLPTPPPHPEHVHVCLYLLPAAQYPLLQLKQTEHHYMTHITTSLKTAISIKTASDFWTNHHMFAARLLRLSVTVYYKIFFLSCVLLNINWFWTISTIKINSLQHFSKHQSPSSRKYGALLKCWIELTSVVVFKIKWTFFYSPNLINIWLVQDLFCTL